VATGFSHFDPTPMTEYGYGRFPNVITAMEMERLNNSAGPTNGALIRPSDGKSPKHLAIINCVGSRDKRYNPSCSNFCCMYAIKNALLLKQMHPDTEISIYYIDIRTPSKGYEEFYDEPANPASASSRDAHPKSQKTPTHTSCSSPRKISHLVK